MTNAPKTGRVAKTNSPTIKIHAAADIDLYQISEHQLTALENGKRDDLVQFAWAMVTLAVGALPSTAVALWKAYVSSPATPLGGIEQLQFAMVLMGLMGAAMGFAVAAARGKTAGNIGSEIRKQKK